MAHQGTGDLEIFVSKKVELAIQLYSSKLERADRALSHNWTIQLILIVLSLFSLSAHVDQFTQASSRYLGFVPDPPTTSAILGALLLSNFIRFGYILGSFLLAREACDKLLESIAKLEETPLVENDLLGTILFETTNFFEPAYQSQVFFKRGMFVLTFIFIVTVCFMALSHAMTIIHIHKAARGYLVIAMTLDIIVATVLGGCYWQMWTSRAGRGSPIKFAIISSLILSISICAWWFLIGQSRFS